MCTSKLSGKLDEMLGVTCDGLASPPRRSSNTVTRFMLRVETGISSRSNGPLGSEDLTFSASKGLQEIEFVEILITYRTGDEEKLNR